MLKPFQVKDLHRSELQQNSAEPTASLKRPSIDDGSDEYQTNIQSQPSHSRCRNGTVQLSSSDYDEIATTHPRARLTYVDDEDGEVITVSQFSWIRLSLADYTLRLDLPSNFPNV